MAKISTDLNADLNRSLITATAAVAGFSSFLFGFLTNMPVALGPGMGLNAYFAYQIVGFHGDGIISYNMALTAVFIEGFVFIFLSLIGMRQWLVKVIPVSLKVAAACGIGLFLALIGLSGSAGIGAVSGARSTVLQVAGCPQEYVQDGMCVSHKMTSHTVSQIILTVAPSANRSRVDVAWHYGWWYRHCVPDGVQSQKCDDCGHPSGLHHLMAVSYHLCERIRQSNIHRRGTTVTYFPDTDLGDNKFAFFKKVASFHPINHTLNALDWNITQQPGNFAMALFTFLYVDIIDCTATLYSMARFSGVVDPETGDFPRSTLAYCTDAFCISFGALLGTSPVTACESYTTRA